MRSQKSTSSYNSQDCLIGSAEDFYHVEQLRHLLGNKLTLPLTVLGHLREGKRVSRRVIERAVRDLQAIAEQFETQPKSDKPKMTGESICLTSLSTRHKL